MSFSRHMAYGYCLVSWDLVHNVTRFLRGYSHRSFPFLSTTLHHHSPPEKHFRCNYIKFYGQCLVVGHDSHPYSNPGFVQHFNTFFFFINKCYDELC